MVREICITIRRVYNDEDMTFQNDEFYEIFTFH